MKEVIGGVQKCHGKESAHERVRGIAGLNEKNSTTCFVFVSRSDTEETDNFLNTVATYNSDTPNNDTNPNSDTTLALTKMSIFRYLKDFGTKNTLNFTISSLSFPPRKKFKL